MKDWTRTAFSERLGLDYPIVQGPFGGGLSSVALTVAVSQAGGLGSFGAHHLDGETIVTTARAIREHTDRPFALNLWLPFDNSENLRIDPDAYASHCNTYAACFREIDAAMPALPQHFAPPFAEQFEAILEAQPAVFSFVYGVPTSEMLALCRGRNIITMGAATTPEEASALAEAGVDMVVASGFEAGGHRVSFQRAAEDSLMGSMSLVPQVADAVSIPVIAAGGISDGRGIAAALMLGADAVQVGTAFLACCESGTTDLHRQQLFSDAARHTALTRVFSGRLARGIGNRLVRDGGELPVLPYPAQNWFMGQLKSAAIEAGNPELMSLWSGQSAPLLRQHRARELFESLVEETGQRLCGHRQDFRGIG